MEKPFVALSDMRVTIARCLQKNSVCYHLRRCRGWIRKVLSTALPPVSPKNPNRPRKGPIPDVRVAVSQKHCRRSLFAGIVTGCGGYTDFFLSSSPPHGQSRNGMTIQSVRVSGTRVGGGTVHLPAVTLPLSGLLLRPLSGGKNSQRGIKDQVSVS